MLSIDSSEIDGLPYHQRIANYAATIFLKVCFCGPCRTESSEDIYENFFTETALKSLVAERSVVIGGHKTSVSLEDPFWNDLKAIAHLQRVALSQVVEDIDRARKQSNLSSAIRLFVLDQVRMGNLGDTK